jgi:nucleoside-diphosphate-sugar epimerase
MRRRALPVGGADVSASEQGHPGGALSPNAAAKLAAELYLCAYAEMFGISPISLALASVYGPRQNRTATPAW